MHLSYRTVLGKEPPPLTSHHVPPPQRPPPAHRRRRPSALWSLVALGVPASWASGPAGRRRRPPRRAQTQKASDSSSSLQKRNPVRRKLAQRVSQVGSRGKAWHTRRDGTLRTPCPKRAPSPSLCFQLT